LAYKAIEVFNIPDEVLDNFFDKTIFEQTNEISLNMNIALIVLLNLISVSSIFLIQGTIRVLALYKNSNNILTTLYLKEKIYNSNYITGRVITTNSEKTIMKYWNENKSYIEELSISNSIIIANAIETNSNILSKHCFSPSNQLNYKIDPNINLIDKNAFKNCKLETIYIPNSIVFIGDNAFEGNNLQEITIPSSVNHIGRNAFDRTVLIKCQANSTAHYYAVLNKYDYITI